MPLASEDPRSGSRAYLIAAGVWALLLCGALVAVASREWFFGDDFAFLAQAGRDRNWWSTFFPVEVRSWWSYRPLTIAVYYETLRSLFDLNPLPYLLTSLTAHVATAALLLRVALQLGLDRGAAIAAALFSLALAPSMLEIFAASTFQDIGARFFYLLTIHFFLDHLQSGRPRSQALACVAMLATLLSNEFGVTLAAPLVLAGALRAAGPPARRLTTGLRRAAPQIGLMAIYAVFRWGLLAPARLEGAEWAAPKLGLHLLSNPALYLTHLLGRHTFSTPGFLLLAGGFGLLLAAGWFCVRRLSDTDRRHFRERTLFIVGWLGALLVPVIGMESARPRAAIAMETPLCLLIGLHLNAIWAMGIRRIRWVEIATLSAVILAVPYGQLAKQAREPRGAIARDLARLISEGIAPDRKEACVRVRTRRRDTWASHDLYRVQFLTSGLTGAMFPKRRVRMLIGPGPRTEGDRETWHCLELQLLPGPTVRHAHGPRINPPGGAR